MSKQHFHILDGMRGIAAIIVMVYHYYMREGTRFLHHPLIAVDFFFILSGFVIMHSYGERIRNGMTLLAYAGRRVIRLYPLMAVGILIGVPVLMAYSALGHTDYSKRDIVASALSNLFFVPFLNDKKVFFPRGTVAGMLFPNDGPLWSIFFEMIASICFIYMAKASRSSLIKFCCGCFILIFCNVLFSSFVDYGDLQPGNGWGTANFFGGFPRVLYGFSCGVLLYQFRAELAAKTRVCKRPDLLTFFLYLCLGCCLIFPYRLYGLFYFLAIAVIAPAIVCIGSSIVNTSVPMTKISEFLGWLSYPIYCLHTPVLIASYIVNEKYGLADKIGISGEIQAMFVTFLLAIIITKLIDEPVRRWLNNRFNKILPST